MPLAVGSALGTLELVEELARGGFGVVYRAVDVDGEEVAVKVLHADLVRDIEATRRFEREIRVVQLIDHRNIVNIRDVGATDEEEPYYVMELLVGETLRERIERGGRLSGDELFEIVAPLCSALEASHEKGVIHRDLKPSNVFLADRVVLLDFGIAKLVEDTGAQITSSRHVIGTPSAMAPEQIRGAPLDARADVYALGALCYHMLAAEPPFWADNIVIMQEMQLYNTPPPLTDKAPVTRAVADVVHRALAKEADERPPSARAFCDQLRAALAGESPAADRPAGDVSGLFVEVHVSIDESTSDEWLDIVDGLLPDLANAVPFEVASASGTTRLFVSTTYSAAEMLEIARTKLPALDGGPVDVSMFAHRGQRQRILELAWVPERGTDRFAVV